MRLPGINRILLCPVEHFPPERELYSSIQQSANQFELVLVMRWVIVGFSDVDDIRLVDAIPEFFIRIVRRIEPPVTGMKRTSAKAQAENQGDPTRKKMHRPAGSHLPEIVWLSSGRGRISWLSFKTVQIDRNESHVFRGQDTSRSARDLRLRDPDRPGT